MKIFKYLIIANDRFHIQMPEGAKIIRVKRQNGKHCLWAIVDPNAIEITHYFQVLGTGEEFNANTGDYVGTWEDDVFIWHLFKELANA